MSREELIEALSSIEHDQWMHWANHLLDHEELSVERQERWESYMVPYDDLEDDIKEFDREWARKVVSLLERAGFAIPEQAPESEECDEPSWENIRPERPEDDIWVKMDSGLHCWDCGRMEPMHDEKCEHGTD